jgi:sugar phosphate permease
MVAWITVIHQIGGATAAFVAGVLRISYGSYLQAFMLSGLLCIVAAFMVLFIGAGRKRREPEGLAAPAQ